MEIVGKIESILEPTSGTSARGEWKRQEVIVEQSGEFGKKACISFWGDKVDDVTKLKVGDQLSVMVNIESREYNGRWYTDLRAWRITQGQGATAGGVAPGATRPQPQGSGGYSSAAPMPSSPSTDEFGGGDDVDDLPF